MTDEQLVAYLDAYSDRLKDTTEAAYDGMVEAVRAGMIFAKSDKQYRRWRTRVQRRSGQAVGLTGQALESAIMGFAAQHPEYVVVGGE